MDLTLAQQIITGVLLWMFIGTIMASKFIIRYGEDSEPEDWSNFIFRMIWLWPTHIFVMLGLWIIRTFKKR